MPPNCFSCELLGYSTGHYEDLTGTFTKPVGFQEASALSNILEGVREEKSWRFFIRARSAECLSELVSSFLGLALYFGGSNGL